VSVPFNAAINPPAMGGFTLEAWVRIKWTDAGAYRCILDSRAQGTSESRGFALFANPANHWEVWVGKGTEWTTLQTDDPFVLPAPGDAITYYVAATYDGANLRIFVDGEQRAGAIVATYIPNDDVAPHVGGPLYIGAAAPFEPLRPGGIGPLAPFEGNIQDVAIYSAPLSAPDIETHKHNGEGTDP
jgi:hypothetical protein